MGWLMVPIQGYDPAPPTPLRSTQSAQDKGEGVGFGRCPFLLYLPFNSIAPTA